MMMVVVMVIIYGALSALFMARMPAVAMPCDATQNGDGDGDK
jgi:hypothetical protein